MANSMGDDSSFIREESDNKVFNRSDNVAVANSDVETNDVNKLKTEVMAWTMFVIEQIYIIKQSVGSSKISVCNCSSKNNIYIDSLCDQINYLREENKMKNSIIQSLLCHSPSRNVNDKGDNTSPISEKVENDNLNNNYDNLFDKAVMIILLILKRICLIKLLMIILLILKRMIMKRIKIVVNL